MAKRAITLTGRAPVTIDEDNWDLIASAKDEDHDGQVRSQANRASKWFIGVRQHEDGRTIVYATYCYSSNWQNARNYAAKDGVILPTDCTDDDIAKAIQNVCQWISASEHHEGDESRWKALAAECIADLPAEVLD